jgi:hypothetical protein
MNAVKYRPGAKAPRTGAYTVTHRTHRLSHIVLVDEGAEFPVCRKCEDDVRFELYMRIQRMNSDRDFMPDEEHAQLKRKVLRFPRPKVG